jgi:predicted O-linked N-acetylglucosamine transferase (SPINDLY family)
MGDYSQQISEGIALLQAGDLARAEQIFQQILHADASVADAWRLLGVVAQRVGKHEVARECIAYAIALRGGDPDYSCDLASTFVTLGRYDEAIAAYQEALRLKADCVEAYNGLGTAFCLTGKLDEAERHCRDALAIRPDFLDAHVNLGTVLFTAGKLDAAADEYRYVVRTRPDFFVAWYNLGNVLMKQWKLEEGAACFEEALRLNPGHVDSLNNLGVAYREQGRIPDAIACCRRAIALAPQHAVAHSNLLYALNYLLDISSETLLAEHLQWAHQHAEPLTALRKPHLNDRSPERRLRIGYVSPYFYEHSINYFVEPMIAAHDHAAFEIFCYSDTSSPDRATKRLRAATDQWRDTRGLSDERLAEQVRDDRIDILVDLTGHIAGSRLLAFARKPAPVQVTYLGYQNTTGMAAIDYRLTDSYADPPGQTDAFYTEKLVRLPRSFFCLQMPNECPEVNILPALNSGHITFGSFNAFAKVTPQLVETWCRLLLAMPDSCLLILVGEATGASRWASEIFASHGIAASRYQFVARCPRDKYFRLYHRVDVALDTFPMNGHTTTCDALWMGVPVVAWSGDRYSSRYGGSALVNVGLERLIAHSADEYIQIAQQLAGDVTVLAKLRRDLRQSVARSPLMEHQWFMHDLEAAYRNMWKTWCQQNI